MAIKIEFEGIVYPTVEHAYQAFKTLNPKIRKQVAELKTPGEAKHFGKSIKLRDCWEWIKLQIMENLLREKFKDKELKQN